MLRMFQRWLEIDTSYKGRSSRSTYISRQADIEDRALTCVPWGEGSSTPLTARKSSTPLIGSAPGSRPALSLCSAYPLESPAGQTGRLSWKSGLFPSQAST